MSRLLSLDNDCILWEAPPAIRQWVEEDDPTRCVAAEDVLACFGQFAPLCGPEPRNGGIRGLPPAFSLIAHPGPPVVRPSRLSQTSIGPMIHTAHE